MKLLPRTTALATLLAFFALSQAGAQTLCTSDGQAQASRLLERFINANCPQCWTDPDTPAARPGEVALDWVVPSTLGEDAALSAVAVRDSLQRLHALRQAAPETRVNNHAQVSAMGLKGVGLRVARGPALNGYMGASIEVTRRPAIRQTRHTPQTQQTQQTPHWTGWLALIETLPPGTEGSPLERNLVRNLLQVDWHPRPQSRAGGPQRLSHRLYEARVMGIPSSASSERLQVVGWVQDGSGQLLGVAQSVCAPEKS